jgi:hypothetical protein
MLDSPHRIINEALLAEVRQQPCAVAGCRGRSQAAHIKSKGAYGGDTEENLMPLCQNHHEFEQHIIGWVRFRERHPEVASYAELKGRERSTY